MLDSQLNFFIFLCFCISNPFLQPRIVLYDQVLLHLCVIRRNILVMQFRFHVISWEKIHVVFIYIGSNRIVYEEIF